MQICGQTLILVDNDATVSEVNQKIIKSTIKYMLYHSPENRAYCISTYEHEVSEAEEFSTDLNDLLCKVDLMEFTPKDSNLTDVLADTITKWREADFACRDILVFTDGLEGINLNYEDEELFYLINNTSYPIYIVDLVQDNNENVRKHLSAICTTSEGRLFMSEFPGDDGGVDKQLSEKIFTQMEEYARREWYETDETSEKATNEATDTLVDTNDEMLTGEDEKALIEVDDSNAEVANSNTIESNSSYEELLDEIDTENVEAMNQAVELTDTEIVYEESTTLAFYEKPENVIAILLTLIVAILVGLVCSMIFIKKRRKVAKQNQEIQDMVSENAIKNDFFGDDEDGKDCFNETFFGDDIYLDKFENVENELSGNEEGETRLLTPVENETVLLVPVCKHKIILIDVEDENNKHTICFDDEVIIGRQSASCDYVINDISVSKRHCQVKYINGEMIISDLESSNGTIVNENKITSVTIKSGDRIKLGKSEYRLRCE